MLDGTFQTFGRDLGLSSRRNAFITQSLTLS